MEFERELDRKPHVFIFVILESHKTLSCPVLSILKLSNQEIQRMWVSHLVKES